MTKNVDIEISIGDIISIAKRRWKIVLLIALVFALFGGMICIIRGFKAADIPITKDTIKQQHLYEINSELHDASTTVAPDAVITLRQEWIQLAGVYKNHPLMSIDPYNCDYEQLTLSFSPESGTHSSTVRNWIESSDNDKLFSSSNKKLEQYKNTLIQVVDVEYSSNETEVIVIETKGFDASNASSYLIDYFQSQAEESNLNLLNISTSHVSGYLETVALFQKRQAETINSVYSAIRNTIDINNAIPAPYQPESISTSNYYSLTTIAKYILIGLIAGLLIGIGIIATIIVIQRKVVSQSQITNAFDIELLSDFSRNDDVALDILNANLDVITHEQSKIMLISTCSSEYVDSITSNWVNLSNRTFIIGKNIVDDPKTIDALRDATGIVIVVRIGESKIDDIQRIILRAKKLNKPVLGYVQL